VNGEIEGGGDAALDAKCDEEFLHTVVSQDVLEGWDALQSFFARFLGGDDPAAWVLVEVTHRPQQILDGEENPTGEWELVSSGKWKRDPEAPTPTRELVIAEELPTLDELEAS
jgi:hypothetical protein